MRSFSAMSGASRLALIFVTIGALLLVWGGVWCFYIINHPDPVRDSEPVPLYVCIGLMLSGLVLALIGVGVGWLYRKSGSSEEERDAKDSKDEHAKNVQMQPTYVLPPPPTVAVYKQPAPPQRPMS